MGPYVELGVAVKAEFPLVLETKLAQHLDTVLQRIQLRDSYRSTRCQYLAAVQSNS